MPVSLDHRRQLRFDQGARCLRHGGGMGILSEPHSWSRNSQQPRSGGPEDALFGHRGDKGWLVYGAFALDWKASRLFGVGDSDLKSSW